MEFLHNYSQEQYRRKPTYTYTQCPHGFKATVCFGNKTCTTEYAFQKKSIAGAKLAYKQYVLPFVNKQEKLTSAICLAEMYEEEI